jgi:hypothetical protein
MTVDIAALNQKLYSGNVAVATDAAEQLAKAGSEVPPEWFITVYDKFWVPVAAAADFIECSGTDPRNLLPSATLKLKGDDELIPIMMGCRKTLVGVTIETEGLRFPFYVDTHEYNFEKGEWTGTANLLGIWDVLNYMQIWPDWYLPIQAQLFSHALYIGPLCTCIEAMICEQAFRLQSGLWEFINNSLSLNPDIRAWFGTLLVDNFNVFEMLKTPVYVVRHNPLLDTSPLIARTVRMESCAAVIKDVTRAYGVDIRVDLWLPGDPQPDEWTATIPELALTQPAYVITVRDRSQITGPTGTVLDSALRTVVDLEGSLLGNVMDPIINPQGNPPGLPQGYFVAPVLGVDWVAPWVLLIAPEPGEKGSVDTCKIVDHTPKGWQHIIGGRSPKWLNDLFNAFWAWVIDSVMILIGITGIPSDLLAGFLNNSFLTFQLVEHYTRRSEVGPYHPAIEVFHATASAPYNVETVFAFVNAFFDSRGWTCVQATFRNGEVYSLGKDIFRGALASVAYLGRTRLYTDYVDNVLWRIDKKTRDVMVQVGDGKAIESPLAKHQRNLTGAMEAINVLTLAPQSG